MRRQFKSFLRTHPLQKFFFIVFLLWGFLYLNLADGQVIPFAFWTANGPCRFRSNVTITSANVATYTNCNWEILNGVIVTLTYNSPININSLTVRSGGNLTHTGCTTTTCYQINLNVSGDVNVNSGGTITADGKGYLGGYVGANSNTQGLTSGNIHHYGANGAQGGSHGGTGSAAGFTNQALAFDSPYQPTDYGGGGGGASATAHGGSGGGVVRLNVTGNVTVNGLISVRGNDVPANQNNIGAGAGGSIWITCNTFSTTSATTILSVAGGGGGTNQSNTLAGGGGRVAIEYTSLGGNFAFSRTYIDAISKQANTGLSRGGIGTILGKPSGETHGDLYIIGDGGNDIWGDTYIGWFSNVMNVTSNTLSYMDGGGFGGWPEATTILNTNALVGLQLVAATDAVNPTLTTITANDATTNLTITSTGTDLTTLTSAGNSFSIWEYYNHFNNVTVENTAFLEGYRIIVDGTMTVTSNSSTDIIQFSVGNFNLTSSSAINPNGDCSYQVFSPPEIIKATGNVLIDGTSLMNQEAAGYASSVTYAGGPSGTTTGAAINNAGASHGGYGGTDSVNYPNALYDSYTQPSLPGSGGAGGGGGGVIIINASGNVEIDGQLKASADPTAANGGGSGGSIWVTAGGSLTSSNAGAIFTANGAPAMGTNGCGGGGGLIALYYGSLNLNGQTSFGSNSVDGSFSINGGQGTNGSGGTGSIFMKPSGSSGSIYFDNYGNIGNYLQTPFPQVGNETFYSINLSNGAVVKQLSSASNITATVTNVDGTGSTLYVPTSGGSGYGTWFSPGTTNLTNSGTIVQY